jgi:hypothetical protein
VNLGRFPPAAVPDLTCDFDIKLNERVPLRTSLAPLA